MKRNLLLVILIGISLASFAAKKPDWVKKRPVDKLAYIGIGFSQKSDPQYMQIAKKQALNDLVSEIKVEIQSHSLLQTMEKDDQFSSFLSNSIQISAQEDLEQFELTDSWEDDKEYWVYYRLSKLDYQDFVARRKAKATREGYSFWTKGNESLNQGDLFTAIDMYIKGLDVIQPCTNEELKQEHNGSTIDVAIELYSSLNHIFNGIRVTPSAENLRLKSFQSASEPVSFTVSKNETPLRNIKLKIGFASGSGQLSTNNISNNSGIVDVHIQNITSKATRQEITATIDASSFSIYNSPFFENALKTFRNSPPRTSISIELEKTEHKAYIRYVGKTNESLTKSIRSLLTNNYFTVVNDPAEANILILLKSSVKKGNKVKGEMYDFNEYFTSVDIQVLDANTSQSLLNYTVNDHRSLSPVSASDASAENTAIKDVMRRVNKEFKKELESLNINN